MKGLMVLFAVLILFVAGCGLLPPTPDANNGLVKIRIPNPRTQQDTYELSVIPEDTETIGIHVEGLNPGISQVKNFGNSDYIEFSFLLPAPGNYKFYLIGANGSKVLTCYSIKQASIQPGITNEIFINVQTYSTSLSLQSNTRIKKFKEPLYSSYQPEEVIWSMNMYSLEFTGDELGALYYYLAWDEKNPDNLYTKYTTDKWLSKSFWLTYQSPFYVWASSPTDTQNCYIRNYSSNTIKAYSEHSSVEFPVFVPLYFFEDNEPYNYNSGNVVISIPIVWEKFNNMEAGFLLPPINMSDLVGDTTIIVE